MTDNAISSRLVISEELFVRFVYLWLRDANLDPVDPYARSHAEDMLRYIFDDWNAPVTDPVREKFARDAIQLAPPGVILPAPAKETKT